MNVVQAASIVAIVSLPLCSQAATVALAPTPATTSACTLTMNFVPTAPRPSADAEPVIFVDTTQSYPIRSFSVAQTSVARAASIATITADLGLESTVASLLDEHAIIERAELACPSKIATLTNATIGYIGTAGGTVAPILSFTMNFWPKNLEMAR